MRPGGPPAVEDGKGGAQSLRERRPTVVGRSGRKRAATAARSEGERRRRRRSEVPDEAKSAMSAVRIPGEASLSVGTAGACPGASLQNQKSAGDDAAGGSSPIGPNFRIGPRLEDVAAAVIRAANGCRIGAMRRYRTWCETPAKVAG